jgi:isopenicillin N synthase-like dioxygenase
MRWPCTCHESSRLRSISKFFVRRSERHVTNMRINYYPVQERPPEREQLRAGAHSDYGAFTILKGENAPGDLQQLRRGGDWADVPIIEDGFVINIGDLLMRWTNDKWVSTRSTSGRRCGEPLPARVAHANLADGVDRILTSRPAALPQAESLRP